jgi:hypothetical protein
MKLTQITLLDRMRIGRDYNLTYLAQYFDVTTAILRDALCALAQEGFVKMINKADGKIAFRRVRNDFPVQGDNPTEQIRSVATFPVTRRLTGILSDYGASLASVRDLALLTRRA